MKESKRYGVTNKYVMLFGILLLITNIVLGVVLMTQSGRTIKKMVKDEMLDIVTTAAGIISADELDSLTEEDVGTKKFEDIKKELSVFLVNDNVVYIYAIKKINEDTFVFTVDTDPENPADFGEELLTVTPALISAGNGFSAVDDERAEDEWGNYYSAFCPVYLNGEIIGIVGVDFDSTRYDEHVRNNLITFLIIISSAVVLSIVIVLIFTNNISNRLSVLDGELNNLSDDVDELAEEIVSSMGQRYGPIDEVVDHPKENEAKRDEIESLGNKVKAMRVELEKYLDYAHALAYTDALTGVCNNAAYIEAESEMEKKIAEGSASFYVAIFDINDLKKINDQFGHAIGNAVIRGAADAIASAFGGDNTFRIGGDEFIAIAENVTEEEIAEKIEIVNAEIITYNGMGGGKGAVLSVSKGLAQYRHGNDRSFKEVFVRADGKMYRDKEEFHRH
ncbi:MAG: GGDEF domain-containing protein [Clostridia bacterium]|nr:GGDEF domain-containing protein [Clostridia bacterium]